MHTVGSVDDLPKQDGWAGVIALELCSVVMMGWSGATPSAASQAVEHFVLINGVPAQQRGRTCPRLPTGRAPAIQGPSYASLELRAGYGRKVPSSLGRNKYRQGLTVSTDVSGVQARRGVLD